MKHITHLKFKITLLSILIGFCSSGLAMVHEFKADDGTVTFLAKGKPALLKIEGKGAGFKGQLTEADGKVSGSLAMDLKSFDTGIELRDEHLKDTYLEVKKFPVATLYLENQAVPKEGSFKFKGQLKIKDVQKPVEGTATLKKVDGGTELLAEFPVQISDYPIGVPKYLGITVAETVQVTAKSKATLAEGENKAKESSQ